MGGSFVYNRLAFGLASGPSTWQKLLEHTLRGIPNLFIYLDDILCFGKSKSDRSKKLNFASNFLRDKAEEEEEVKFLYESKSGKSIRRSMAWSEDHEPDTISEATKPYLDELIMENR